MRIWIEPPRNSTVIEGMNSTVEYCVVIAEPSMAAPIERNGFFVCVSSVDGTAVGKNNNRGFVHVFNWHHDLHDIIHMCTILCAIVIYLQLFRTTSQWPT